MNILTMEQGSYEWFESRLGIPTASHFKDVMSNGRSGAISKTRQTYMMQLVSERILGKPTEHHFNDDMQRGKDLEPKARVAYYLDKRFGGDDVGNIEQVGIVLNIGAGYSPDGFVGADGCIEIKCPRPHNHLRYIYDDVVPAEHTPQVQGGLLISEREWCDFISYCPGFPIYIKRAHRDEKLIKKIKESIEEFNEQLDAFEQKVRAM